MQLVFRGHYADSTQTMPSPLRALFKVLDGWRGEQTFVEMLKLVSKGETSSQQDIHVDSISMLAHLIEQRKRVAEGLPRQRMALRDKSFSCLVSLALNACPTSFVKSNGEKITIPRGHILIWDGDYPHAGAEYHYRNERLFLHISSEKVNVQDRGSIGYDRKKRKNVQDRGSIGYDRKKRKRE
jgi:hypothetical protein